MLSTSFAFRKAIADGRHLLNSIALTMQDGTTHNLDGAALTMGGITISSSSSQSGSFSIGAAVVGTAEIVLANYHGEWDDADFTNATAVIKVGCELENGTVEWLRKGVYGVEQPESYDSTIALDLRDNMRLFERDYSEVSTVYPATLRTIVSDICSVCGVTMLSASFPRDTQVVATRPDDSRTSCLDVLSWAAQMACCFCDCDPWGRLRVRWYDTSAFETEDWLDGGSYETVTIPYSDGDAADGGWFHGGGVTADGGSFTQPRWALITAIKSLTTATDDVVITGVRVTASDEMRQDGTYGSKGETYLYGNEGYVLEISNNDLIQYGCAQSVAISIGDTVVGMRFRPLTVSCLGDPSIEAGDPVLVIDRRQRTYRAWATSNTWKAGGIQSISCDAETPARKQADSYSATTRSIVQYRNAARAEVTARERAISDLAEQLAESSGLFMTKQEQQDHSYIYYMHDKPTLQDSQIVWKLTANALGISTDGGVTYPYGLDVSGNAILQRIYTIGLDADYINTGALVVKSNGATVFSADVDTGIVSILGECVTIGTESLTTAIDGVRALYGTCTTAASTTAKVVTCQGFELRTGSVVNVRFTNKNTASSPTLNVNGTGAKPIYLNGSPIGSDYYWDAQDVVTFVYSGSYWYVADSGTLSKIKATADSISLSVSNGVLGSTASIKLSVNGGEQTKTLDLTGVRNAFKNDPTAITISAGTVTFDSNTFVVNSTNFSVTASGVITATSGTIGGFTIGRSSLYNGKTSLQSLTYGVYVGTGGISVGSGSAYTALADGYLYGGGSASSTHGYVGFNNYWTDTGIYGTRLAGRGCIALLTNGAFGIGSYYNFGSNATISTGQTKSVSFISSVGYHPDDQIEVSVSPSYVSQRWVFYNSAGEERVYNTPVSVMTGVSVSVSIPRLTRTTSTIQFTQGLMTTS